jgi:hypothetical protein
VAAAARALDLAESALWLWVRRAEREARRTGALGNGERRELTVLCRVFRVSLARFYAAQRRPVSPRITEEAQLATRKQR